MSRREDEKRHVQFSSSLSLIQLTVSSTLLMRILIDVRFHSTPFISRSIALDSFVRVNDSNRAQMEHREKEREKASDNLRALTSFSNQGKITAVHFHILFNRCPVKSGVVD